MTARCVTAIAGACLTIACAFSARADMTIDGTKGRIVLSGESVRIETLDAAGGPLGPTEAAALEGFPQAAAEAGYYASLVVDTSDADIAYYFIGLHRPEDALAMALAHCRELAADSASCVEAARAVPAGGAPPSEDGERISRAAAADLMALAGGVSQGFVAVAVSGIGSLAVSGALARVEDAEAQAMGYCVDFASKAMDGLDPSVRGRVRDEGLDACRVIFVK